MFNLDTCGYASDLTCMEQVLAELGPLALDAAGQGRHTLLGADLSDAQATADAASMPDVDHEDDQFLIADLAVCAVRPAAHHIGCAAATRSAQFRQHPHPMSAQRGRGDSPPEPSGPAAGTSPGAAGSPTRRAPTIPARAAALLENGPTVVTRTLRQVTPS